LNSDALKRVQVRIYCTQAIVTLFHYPFPDVSVREAVRTIISDFRLVFAKSCVLAGEYREAAMAFLAADPPAALDAINAAKSAGI